MAGNSSEERRGGGDENDGNGGHLGDVLFSVDDANTVERSRHHPSARPHGLAQSSLPIDEMEMEEFVLGGGDDTEDDFGDNRARRGL